MMKLIVDGDKVYVLEVIEAPRNVNPKASRTANELIVFGFNKRLHPELFEKYRKEILQNGNKV